MSDLQYILRLLKNLGFKVSDKSNDFVEFDKLDSPLKIKITQAYGAQAPMEAQEL